MSCFTRLTVLISLADARPLHSSILCIRHSPCALHGDMWLTVCKTDVLYERLCLTVCQIYYCIVTYGYLSVRLVYSMMT